MARVPGSVREVDVLVTSIGDCTLLVAQAIFSVARLAQLALFMVSTCKTRHEV